MPRIRQPRSGSMQFWPRKRAKGTRVRSYPAANETKLLGFAGYKVGMTHVIITDNRKTTLTKGQEISCPVTIVECPPIKAAGIRFYKKSVDGLKAVSEVLSENLDKEIERAMIKPKKIKKKIEDITDFDDIRMIVYTQPKLTGIGNKKPEIFELALGGKKEDKLKYAKEKLGKEIAVSEVFKDGQQMDIHAITTGKGIQGPVKRFGVSIRRHKSEKTKRGPGSLGAWKGQGHMMYRVAHAGQMGYHLRTDYNKWIIKIGDKPEEINTKSGYRHYGNIKNNYLIVRGSVAGPAKRFLRLNQPIRPNYKIPAEAPLINYISRK